jgi:hypothetical protein
MTHPRFTQRGALPPPMLYRTPYAPIRAFRRLPVAAGHIEITGTGVVRHGGGL